MDAANDLRGEEFAEALYEEGMEAGFLDPAGLDLAAADLLGSTTHISVLDGDGHVRQRHLLQRLRLRRAGAGDRGDPQQHARRGGPQPARLPPDRAGAAGALDDGADRGPARRRDRARARQRRLQPDPLGDPADGRARGRAGDAGGGGDRGAAPALRGRASSRPSRGSTRRRWRGSRRAGSPSPAGPQINLFFGGVQAVARDPRDRRPQRRRRPPPRRRVAYAD